MHSARTTFLVTAAAGLLTSLSVPQAQPAAAPQAPAALDLRVPPGFVVERVAGPPLVNRPIVADFDEEGRLYVADSSGSNDKVDKQLAERPHRIVRLEDTDGDGTFDRSVVFADRMMFPEGAMWLDGSLYVAAPPSIWKLTDTDNDGVADRREEWLQGKTLTGCANDLHGPYPGPDGWIYWTKGAFAEQTYERPGRAPLVTKASHIFRRRPGDPRVDVVMTGGMDNPVDVAFTPGGERILTATFVHHPEAGMRDGLLHAVYGGVYGKPHNVIDGHKRTGDLMPVLDQLGPAVPAGLTRYGSTAFGEGFRDNFFAAMFNLRKVTRHELTPSGATFTVRDTDFLVSPNRDFHPTDVIEDADGSLLVIDTGPWYKLCCPTSQLAKPDILGGIYRIRRAGAPKIADPRGRALDWATMAPDAVARLLEDPRPAVRDRAVRELGKQGAAAIAALAPVLRASASADARRSAVWALTRIDSASAREATRPALEDTDESVRHAAIHAAGLLRDAGASAQLGRVLTSGSPALQRAAAEALGRIGDPRAVPAILAAAATPVDRILEHSLIYALIEIDDPRATESAGLQASSAPATRAALIALDQMDGGRLTPDRVAGLLDSPDPVLRDTAWWIAGNHPEWGGALAGYFEKHLGAPIGTGSPSSRPGAAAAGPDSAETRRSLHQKLAQFGGDAAIQALLARTVTIAPSKPEQVEVLKTMAVIGRTTLKALPASWVPPLLDLLASGDDDVVAQALAVLRTVSPADSQGSGAGSGMPAALMRVARDGARPVETRLDALAALGGGTALDADLFELLRSSLAPMRPLTIRSAAAAVVEKARLEPSQLVALASSIESAGPIELPRLLRAYAGSGDETAGLALVASLRRARSRSAVRADVLRPVLAKYPESVRTAADALLAAPALDSAAKVQRLEALLQTLQGGDVTRGQAVFNGPRAACTSCHMIGYIGGRIGPDLTRIGQVRSERDLLEAIVFPSASFARGYEPVTIRTRGGEARGGVLRSESPDEIVLVTAQGEETRVPRRDVAEIQPGTISLMPEGFDQQLTRQELADLLAFLKGTRSGAD